jgi:acetyl-CoA C-acetyltransferase
MGEHQAISTRRWGIGRAEQDEWAVGSHRKLAAAYDRGFFDDLVTPYLGLERDQNLRPDTSVDKLAELKPVFGLDGPDPTMTAGNSTPLTDGAASVLLASDEWAAERSLPVLAHLVDAETAAVDFVAGDDLLGAPLWAVPRLLDRNGLALQDFDFYEIHEAFASQVLMTLKAWQDPEFCSERLGRNEPLGAIDTEKINVVGSSLATGHPFGATGAKIVSQLAKLLAERGSGRGLIVICAAGGQGVCAILERREG